MPSAFEATYSCLLQLRAAGSQHASEAAPWEAGWYFQWFISYREKKIDLLDVIVKQKRAELNGKASSHVRGRTTWKAGLFLCLIIEKQSRFWLCIHPPDLNEAIKRQHFPIKTPDKVAAKL